MSHALLLGWVVAAHAQKCPAAEQFLVESGAAAEFTAGFWARFVDGMVDGSPPELRDTVRRDALAFWRPRLEAAIDQWTDRELVPLMSHLLVEKVDCRVFERAQRRSRPINEWVVTHEEIGPALAGMRPTIDLALADLKGVLGPFAERDGHLFADWVRAGGTTGGPVPLSLAAP